jgi:hypothetical protein
MAKGKGGEPVFKRFWIRGSEETRKALAHLAIDVDTSAEKLAGILLADAIARVHKDPEALRRLMPRPR